MRHDIGRIDVLQFVRDFDLTEVIARAFFNREGDKEAGAVLQAALSGKKADAEAGLSDKGKFTTASMKLTVEMMGWAKDAK